MDEFAAYVAGHVGGRIRRRRRAIDMTQEELALDAGVSRSQVSLIEHGKVMPKLDTLILFARALDMTDSQLLAGLDVMVIDRRRLRPFVPPERG
jgi:transcriptional regulator with XRE-family HTH domain